MTFLVWLYTFEDFALTQQKSTQSHDCMTETFRNSGWVPNRLSKDNLFWGTKFQSEKICAEKCAKILKNQV